MRYINVVSYGLNLAWFVAVGSLLVLRLAWAQPHEEPQATALAMMEIAQGTLRGGHRLVADAALPPSPHEIARHLCDGPPGDVRPPMLPPPSLGPLAASPCSRHLCRSAATWRGSFLGDGVGNDAALFVAGTAQYGRRIRALAATRRKEDRGTLQRLPALQVDFL
jgi:hypothetical protein